MLAEASDSENDCRSVTVQLDGETARVELTTHDGRQAVRPLKRPQDLVPTLTALMVTVQAEAKSDPRSSNPTPPTNSEAKVTSTTRPTDNHLVLAALGGVRLGLPGSWLSPALTGAVGFTSDGWEAGVTGSFLPASLPLAQTPPAGFRSSDWSLALSGGLRTGSGSVLWLLGADLGVAFVHEEVSNDDVMMTGEVDENADGSTVFIDPIEVHVGVHAGLAFPRRARLRLRPQVSLRGAPVRFADRRASDSPLPNLPRLSGELALGVEGDLL